MSPAPSCGAAARVSKGFSQPSIRNRKKAATTPSTAVAHGAMSRSERRVRNSDALANSDSSVAQSSSEPSWVAHRAVTL